MPAQAARRPGAGTGRFPAGVTWPGGHAPSPTARGWPARPASPSLHLSSAARVMTAIGHSHRDYRAGGTGQGTRQGQAVGSRGGWDGGASCRHPWGASSTRMSWRHGTASPAGCWRACCWSARYRGRWRRYRSLGWLVPVSQWQCSMDQAVRQAPPRARGAALAIPPDAEHGCHKTGFGPWVAYMGKAA